MPPRTHYPPCPLFPAHSHTPSSGPSRKRQPPKSATTSCNSSPESTKCHTRQGELGHDTKTLTDTQKAEMPEYGWTVIGPGPTGIATSGRLLDHGIALQTLPGSDDRWG